MTRRLDSPLDTRELNGNDVAINIASEPFNAPADREMLPSERRIHVRTHHMCFIGFHRRDDGPAMLIAYYVPVEKDELVVAALPGHSNRGRVPRDGRVSLCILDERWPFAYLHVHAEAVVERDPDLVVDVMTAVGARLSHRQHSGEHREFLREMVIRDNRVAIRCRPYATFAHPTHSLGQSATLPWDAPDPS